MDQKVKQIIKEALTNLGVEEVDFVVEHPEDLKNGDYSTNVAMVSAKKLKTNPKELAEKVKNEIIKNLPKKIERIEIAGGFINFYLSRKFFSESIEKILNEGDKVGKNNSLENKKIMVEYTDPNPFKPFHIGHLMTNAIGESIASILEHSGADVSRANYQGDVGLHVARAIYGLLQDKSLQDNSGTQNIQAANIGKAYVLGSQAYESDVKGLSAKKEIGEINKKVYDRSDEKINEIYDWGFKVTMEAFEDLYKILGTKFDYYFLESAMADMGLEIVEANKGKIFEESDGAIVFKADKHDPKLHTRVFVTSKGLPTYETKELGLTVEKFKTIPDMNQSIVITANEQMEYMRVVAKAMSLIHPEFANKMLHITHGMMRLGKSSLGKMGSRTGNVITGESLIRETITSVKEKITENDWTEEEKEKVAEAVGVAAIKYSILRSKSGGDIIFNADESISVEGDSGPYLQYSYARANSVIEKAKRENILPDYAILPEETFEVEKLLYKFGEIVERSAQEYEPHYIANYLIEVARSYNSFYANNVIVKKEDKNSSYKVALSFAFSFVMKTGLHLLGMRAPERM